MKITFLGAAHEVTGSCTLIEAAGHCYLVDCGMEQGTDIFENQELPVSPTQVDAVFLTHAHIDHSGNLPLLARGGFRGYVYATPATCALSEVMLRDSTHIQEFEAEWRNRKAKRAGENAYVPLYEMKDTEAILKKMRPCRYGQTIRVGEGVEIRFNDVGHLLGSAAIEIWVREDGVSRKFLFSGDIGAKNRPVVRDPQPVAGADYVVIESTYGTRSHESTTIDPVPELAAILNRTFARGGNVVIPSFAVGRTQEILYYLREIKEKGLVSHCPHFSVYMDSPLANQATKIFMQCEAETLDNRAAALLAQGKNPFWFENLICAETSDESKAINSDKTPKVIISASGMCEAGRVRHHLKHNLWRPECTILFVGYQSAGTLGRVLQEGAEKVRLFGEEIEVRAEIERLPGMSGHADREGLLDWVRQQAPKPKAVFVNHGDEEACEGFAATLKESGYEAYAPYSGAIFDGKRGVFETVTQGIRTSKKRSSERAKTVYGQLVSSAEALLAAVKAAEGRSNKDLASMASQIRAFMQKNF